MKKFLLIFILIFTNLLWAEEKPGRWIDLEWDEIEGAKGYDISLSELIDGKEFPRGIFHSDSPHWSKEEKPGNYLLRIRALDKRKVPGPWGDSVPFLVSYQNPQLISPTVDNSIIKDENKINEIIFQWSNVYGAQNYLIVIKNQKNEVLYYKTLSSNSIKVNLDKIGSYSWNVVTLNSNKTPAPEAVTCEQRFFIKGEKLKAPILDFDFSNPKGLVVKWNEISRAESFSYSLNSLDGKNEKQFYQNVTTKTSIGIPYEKIPNPKWFLSVKSQANNYTDSNDSRAIFNKRELVSNESLYNELNFRVLNPSKLSFVVGFPSYNYTNSNYETDTINHEKLRGTNLAVEYTLSFLEKYNFYSNLELAQLADSYSTLNIIESVLQVRKIFGNRYFNIQFGGGAKLKSLSNISSNRLEATKTTKSNPSFNLGGAFSLQINKKWNEKIENEIYLEGSRAILSLKNPDKFSPSEDYLINFKTMYNINSSFNININYKIKNISNSYKAQTGINSFALNGDINKTIAKSNYILFGSEYFY